MNQDQTSPYVLLIDDDVDISDAIKSILSDEGHEVVCAHNGLEGLSYLRSRQQKPSLILLDIMMPKMNGYEFRAEQLKDDSINKIPTVVFSAAGRFDEEDAFQFTATVKKPLDLQRLIDLVKMHLG